MEKKMFVAEGKDNVNHPSHYKNENGIECIDVMIANYGIAEVMSFCKLNAFKYLWRAPNKNNADEDIKKASWYLQKYKELSKIESK